MNHPCTAATCRHCRPGRPCAATARWMADEDYYARVEVDPVEGDGPTLRERMENYSPASYIDRHGDQQWADPERKVQAR